MFSNGDYINYSTWGICRIEDLKFIQFDSKAEGCYYFVLAPVFQKNSTVYVPADNNPACGIRPIPSPEQIDEIIDNVKTLNLPWITDRKKRLSYFQKILRDRNETELILMIDRIRNKALDEPRALSGADIKIMKEAELIIEREFSFSLKLNADDIGDYIRRKLQANGSDSLQDEET